MSQRKSVRTSTAILPWSLGGGAVWATLPAAIVLKTVMTRGEHEGAGIVIGLAIVICIPVGVLVGATIGLLMATSERRWFRFSLRTLFVVLAVATGAYDLMVLAM